MDKQYQMCDIMAGKGVTKAQSNEHLRIAKDGAYMNNMSNNFDPTREHLNFEVGKGGAVMPVNKEKSIPRRIKENLKARGIKNPNEGLSEKELKKEGVGKRIVANFILGGSREQMHRLAFGDQVVNLKHGSDNSHITRNSDIEKWAVDMYNFIGNKYGEENIAAFIVHLDEKNPHVHCTLLPITPNNKFSWKKVMAGKDKFEYQRRMKALHDELAEVNKKYNLARGEDISVTGAKHRSTEEYNEALKEESVELAKKNEGAKQELYARNKEIRKAEKRLKGLTTMLSNLELKKAAIENEIKLLEEQLTSGEMKVEEYEQRKLRLEKDIKDINDKIAVRREQLITAKQQLERVTIQRTELEDDVLEFQRQLRKDLPKVEEKIMQEGQAKAWQMTTERMNENFNKIQQFRSTLTPVQLEEFDSLFSNDDMVGAIIEGQSEQVVAVASALFLGFIDQATNYVQSHGGGGSPGSGWGRDKDDDDDKWWRKCFAMGRQMMMPTTKKRLKR